MSWNPKNDIYKHFATTPDQELLLWEEWIRIRESEVMNLAQHTERPPVDLVMHGPEKIREKKEMKQVLEYAQISKNPLCYGHYCEEPLRLYQRCVCENTYDLQKTMAEKGNPQIQVHVGIPDYILKNEKGMMGESKRNKCELINKDYEDYKKKRKEELKEKILKIDPYNPDIRELVVIGTRPKPPSPKPPLLPTLTISEPQTPPIHALSGVYACRINNTIFFKQIPSQPVPHLQALQKEPWHEFCQTWSYYFNNPESKIGRAKLYLQNIGTVSLRYCWKKIVRNLPITFDEPHDQVFFFYNSEDVIPPGHQKIIIINFVSAKPGIFSESWELNFQNICFFDTMAEKLVIHLCGDATENIKKINKRIEKVQNRIERKMIRHLSFELMNEAISEAVSIEHEIYPYKQFLLEREFFVAKNIVCFYHQTEVQTLKSLYTEMTKENWDLCLRSWKAALVKKEYDERMYYYDLFKKSYVQLLRPWYEGEDILIRKHAAVKRLLGALADSFYTEKKRAEKWNGVEKKTSQKFELLSPVQLTPLTPYTIKNIFYLQMYSQVCSTMEQIAGIVSSLDLERWIEFDFCKY